jgi:hypothetical protein
MRSVTLPLLLVLALGAGASTPLEAQGEIPRCEYSKAHPVPEGSTLEDQFRCYKSAGRKVSLPGTRLAHGSANGAGCIISIAADRVQIASCNGFTDRAITIPFASIRAILEERGKDYVTLDLRE